MKTKGTERAIKMQSCKCHVQTPVSQCYFHPPLQKSKTVCCMSASSFSCHSVYKDSQSGDEEKSQQND